MTEAGWTHQTPIEPGWYWTRARPNAMATILYFDGRSFGRMDKKLATTFREYVGPLSPDSFQQGRVAGLRQGIEKLREREKFYMEQEAISQGQMRLTRGLQRNESSCCIHELEQLAQQAQEGK